MRLFIISNRLPLKVSKNGERFVFSRSEGGVATGLESLKMSVERYWIGWPGIVAEKREEQDYIRSYLEKFNFYPVFLSASHIQKYYEGYSNSTIWPLCHYFFSYVQHNESWWESYCEVNALFRDTALKYIGEDDIVWIQDYQLMLLPGMLRKALPFISIGYFHHIPFPAYELFRILPEKEKLLNGLLGADLVAFHTHDYMRYFITASHRISRVNFNEEEVQLVNRIVHVAAFPMGINFRLYYDCSLDPVVQSHIVRLKQTLGGHKLILTVDRLDYSKGILHRLKGFTLFLQENPEYCGKVSLVMIIVPSRAQVEKYADLKMKIDEMIGAVNGQYATLDWIPIHYFYHGFSFEELAALYYIADVALVTPLRDGMNLVAKEYVAAKRDKPGVLVLSEMAGAAIELPQALIVNPNDIAEIAMAIGRALEMPLGEQLIKLHAMQDVISRQTVDKWASDFVETLARVREKNNVLYRKLIGQENLSVIRTAYQHAVHRLIMLDYDGTLVGFQELPEEAIPSEDLYFILKSFVSDAQNTVVICSGRDHQTLEKWFGSLPLQLAAEHGAFYKERDCWEKKVDKELWDDEVIHLIQQVIRRTPGSMLEVKQTALVWHYRNVSDWLAYVREKQLIDLLREPCERLGLQIMRGNRIVEIKSPAYTKGAVVKELLRKNRFDFLMAIGDDTTDEDMFKAMPFGAFTIKVGNISDNARYNLCAQSQTLPFLKNLLSGC